MKWRPRHVQVLHEPIFRGAAPDLLISQDKPLEKGPAGGRARADPQGIVEIAPSSGAGGLRRGEKRRKGMTTAGIEPATPGT